jgi:hypothetical protein
VVRRTLLLLAGGIAGLAVAAPAGAATPYPAMRVGVSASSVVDFAQLARFDAKRRSYAPLHPGLMPEPQEKAEPNVHITLPSPFRSPLGLPNRLLSSPSPSPAQSFLAQLDSARNGTSTSFIPPDTAGAVGPTRLMSTLNSNYVVQDRPDGKVVASVSMATFWASVGAAMPFDPRVLYDPYSGRWLVAAVSDPGLADSAVLYGISDSTDPAGGWHLYSVEVDPTGATWADFPTLGFNQRTVAIGFNLFTSGTGDWAGLSKVLVLDYPALKAGSAAPTTIAVPGSFTVQPAVTYSPTESTLYLVEHGASGAGTYYVFSLAGTTLTGGDVLTNPLGPWTLPGSGDVLPQLGGYPVDSADARIGNAVFRNGHVYYAQTVGLPVGGEPGNPRRTAIQWVELDRNGAFVQGGRIVDPSASRTNGGRWYAYPSLSVNAEDDVLVGFSIFRSSAFPAAGYAFRYGTDPPNAMRAPVVLKSGQDTYYKTFGGGRNRWGDYSATQVDPLDDRSLWTIQEYAARSAGGGDDSGRWATWWGKVDPSAVPRALAPPCRVPRVLGLKLAKARTRIRSRHCSVGKITRKRSTKAKRSRVIAQSPAVGRRLANHARVRLTVGR